MMFVWSVVGVVLLLKSKNDERFVPWLPGYARPGVAALSGLIVTLLSIGRLGG